MNINTSNINNTSNFTSFKNSLQDFNTKTSKFFSSYSIPGDTIGNMQKAMLFGSVITLISTNKVGYSLRMGLFFSTATLIHGLVTPLFKYFFKNNHFSEYVEMGRGTSALVLAALISVKVFKTPIAFNALIGHIAFYALRLYMPHGEMQSPSNSNIIAPVFTLKIKQKGE
jgi:hypothetical protein